ncbi:MAG TPA: hypothetical protein VM143_00965 [Acidimicrobiales bacterium]|nr:hypothetical protein [Acidimicrobiales bacterium]
MRSAPVLVPLDTLTVLPWPDQVIDALGHHPCSPYVESFWLGVLGPSTTFLLRHLVTSLEASPDGVDLELAVTARRLGLGDKGGRHSPFMRSLARLVQFELAELEDDATLLVRRRVPPLNRRQVTRLPELLQTAHLQWQEQQLRTPPLETMRRRARQLALTYLETGLDADETERQLWRLDYHPSIAHESTRWALERREVASDGELRVR